MRPAHHVVGQLHDMKSLDGDMNPKSESRDVDEGIAQRGSKSRDMDERIVQRGVITACPS